MSVPFSRLTTRSTASSTSASGFISSREWVPPTRSTPRRLVPLPERMRRANTSRPCTERCGSLIRVHSWGNQFASAEVSESSWATVRYITYPRPLDALDPFLQPGHHRRVRLHELGGNRPYRHQGAQVHLVAAFQQPSAFLWCDKQADLVVGIGHPVQIEVGDGEEAAGGRPGVHGRVEADRRALGGGCSARSDGSFMIVSLGALSVSRVEPKPAGARMRGEDEEHGADQSGKAGTKVSFFDRRSRVNPTIHHYCRYWDQARPLSTSTPQLEVGASRSGTRPLARRTHKGVERRLPRRVVARGTHEAPPHNREPALNVSEFTWRQH